LHPTYQLLQMSESVTAGDIYYSTLRVYALASKALAMLSLVHISHSVALRQDQAVLMSANHHESLSSYQLVVVLTQLLLDHQCMCDPYRNG